MTHWKYRILFALMIPVLLANLSITSLSGAVHAMVELGCIDAHDITVSGAVDGNHCPACPDDHHHDNDHRHISCEHHSPLYFGGHSPSISYRPSVTAHKLIDPFKAFPEVYQDRFIPPEELA